MKVAAIVVGTLLVCGSVALLVLCVALAFAP